MFSYESLASLFKKSAEDDSADDDEDAPNFPWQGFGGTFGFPAVDAIPVSGDDRPFFPVAEAVILPPVELGVLERSMTIGRPLRLIRRATFTGLT